MRIYCNGSTYFGNFFDRILGIISYSRLRSNHHKFIYGKIKEKQLHLVIHCLRRKSFTKKFFSRNVKKLDTSWKTGQRK